MPRKGAAVKHDVERQPIAVGVRGPAASLAALRWADGKRACQVPAAGRARPGRPGQAAAALRDTLPAAG
jgi:hypothetical protein